MVRDVFERRFTATVMARNYLRLYWRLYAGANKAGIAPRRLDLGLSVDAALGPHGLGRAERMSQPLRPEARRHVPRRRRLRRHPRQRRRPVPRRHPHPLPAPEHRRQAAGAARRGRRPGQRPVHGPPHQHAPAAPGAADAQGRDPRRAHPPLVALAPPRAGDPGQLRPGGGAGPAGPGVRRRLPRPVRGPRARRRCAGACCRPPSPATR